MFFLVSAVLEWSSGFVFAAARAWAYRTVPEVIEESITPILQILCVDIPLIREGARPVDGHSKFVVPVPECVGAATGEVGGFS